MFKKLHKKIPKNWTFEMAKSCGISYVFSPSGVSKLTQTIKTEKSSI